MIKKIFQLYVFLGFMITTQASFAVDSYRYAHVTIQTPWMIFLFLLVIVLFPFILSAILYWYFATKNPKKKEEDV
jgi:hypothetical protein